VLKHPEELIPCTVMINPSRVSRLSRPPPPSIVNINIARSGCKFDRSRNHGRIG